MIGHRTRLRENVSLTLWRAPAKRKSGHFLMCALVTHEIMRSKDAQCNTKE